MASPSRDSTLGETGASTPGAPTLGESGASTPGALRAAAPDELKCGLWNMSLSAPTLSEFGASTPGALRTAARDEPTCFVWNMALDNENLASADITGAASTINRMSQQADIVIIYELHPWLQPRLCQELDLYRNLERLGPWDNGDMVVWQPSRGWPWTWRRHARGNDFLAQCVASLTFPETRMNRF